MLVGEGKSVAIGAEKVYLRCCCTGANPADIVGIASGKYILLLLLRSAWTTSGASVPTVESVVEMDAAACDCCLPPSLDVTAAFPPL